MTRKNLETLVEMIHHVQIESTEEEEAILDLYYHLRLAVERKEQTEEPKAEKPQAEEAQAKEKAEKQKTEETEAEEAQAMTRKPGGLTKEERALKQETHARLCSGAYTLGELSEASGIAIGVILDLKNAGKANIAVWRALAEAMDEIDMNREEE